METLAKGLFMKQTPEGLEISGKTYDNRDLLKSLGGKWNAEKKVWVLPLTANVELLRQPPPPPAPAPVPRPVPRQKVFRTWICGNKKAKLDPYNPQGPMIWVCSCCPTYKSDYDGT